MPLIIEAELMSGKPGGITNVDHKPGGEAPPPAVKNPPKPLITVLALAAIVVVAFAVAIAVLGTPEG